MSSETITKNDLKAILDEVLPWKGTEALTPTITVSTGTLVRYACKRYGNVIWITILARNTSAVAVGNMVFTATISGIPLPADWVTTGCYYGARPWTASLSSAGSVNIRNTYSASTTMGATDYVAASFTYVV